MADPLKVQWRNGRRQKKVGLLTGMARVYPARIQQIQHFACVLSRTKNSQIPINGEFIPDTPKGKILSRPLTCQNQCKILLVRGMVGIAKLHYEERKSRGICLHFRV
jgi:hypothetical protein